MLSTPNVAAVESTSQQSSSIQRTPTPRFTGPCYKGLGSTTGLPGRGTSTFAVGQDGTPPRNNGRAEGAAGAAAAVAASARPPAPTPRLRKKTGSSIARAAGHRRSRSFSYASPCRKKVHGRMPRIGSTRSGSRHQHQVWENSPAHMGKQQDDGAWLPRRGSYTSFAPRAAQTSALTRCSAAAATWGRARSRTARWKPRPLPADGTDQPTAGVRPSLTTLHRLAPVVARVARTTPC